jgi:hypothetical protein
MELHETRMLFDMFDEQCTAERKSCFVLQLLQNPLLRKLALTSDVIALSLADFCLQILKEDDRDNDADLPSYSSGSFDPGNCR